MDIHLHDAGEVGAQQIEMICARATQLAHDVTISHCFALSSVDERRAASLLDTIAAAGLSVATVAPGTWGPMPLEKMKELGIGLGLGQDGMRDYWSPYGTGDMLDRTWQLAFTNGFRADELIEHCMALASIGGASILNGDVRLKGVADRPGVAAGHVADLLLVDGETVASTVMDRSPDRTVIHRGRVVADQLELI